MDEWVIIVDDNEADRNTAGNALERLGAEVTLTGSGKELLELLRENDDREPDLILLDTAVPETDGFETLEALREQRTDRPEIPVIFLAADEESEIRAFRMEAWDCIRKPFDPDVLTTRVQNALRLSAKIRSLEGADRIDDSETMSLESVTMLLEEKDISHNAMWMGREAFINVYQYMVRHMARYHNAAYRVLFTVNPVPEDADDERRILITEEFRKMIQGSLRNSDVMVEVSRNQIFLLLPETQEAGVKVVIDRLMNKWNGSEFHDQSEVTWEAGPVHFHDRETPDQAKRRNGE